MPTIDSVSGCSLRRQGLRQSRAYRNARLLQTFELLGVRCRWTMFVDVSVTATLPGFRLCRHACCAR